MAAPYKLHGGNRTTRSLRAWNECTKREYPKEGRTTDTAPKPIICEMMAETWPKAVFCSCSSWLRRSPLSSAPHLSSPGLQIVV